MSHDAARTVVERRDPQGRRAPDEVHAEWGLLWIVPALGRWVLRETEGEYLMGGGGDELGSCQLEDRWRWELQAWT